MPTGRRNPTPGPGAYFGNKKKVEKKGSSATFGKALREGINPKRDQTPSPNYYYPSKHFISKLY